LNSLVPLCVTALTSAPVKFPWRTSYGEIRIWNSLMASSAMARPPTWAPSVGELPRPKRLASETPSTWMLLNRLLCPAALWRPLGSVLTCGERRVRSATSRLSVGRRRTSVSLAVVCVPWRVGVKSAPTRDAVTATSVSCVACARSATSRRVVCESDTTTPGRTSGANPMRRTVTT
jgi:hypothetical protein